MLTAGINQESMINILFIIIFTRENGTEEFMSKCLYRRLDRKSIMQFLIFSEDETWKKESSKAQSYETTFGSVYT